MRNRKNRYNFFQSFGSNSNPKGKSILKITVLLVLFLTGLLASAQEIDNKLEYRSELDLSYKLNKKLKVYFIPEIRFNESFSPKKYLFDGGLAYKPTKFLRIEGLYGYVINPRTNSESEYYNRYALSAKVNKEIGRFNSAFRIRYTNDADDENTNEQFLRYKFSVDYNIPKFKFTPKLGVEAFQQLGNDGGMYKLRYSVGVDYKLFKNNYLGLAYKFDYYYTEYLNKHIIGLGYKIKF